MTHLVALLVSITVTMPLAPGLEAAGCTADSSILPKLSALLDGRSTPSSKLGIDSRQSRASQRSLIADILLGDDIVTTALEYLGIPYGFRLARSRIDCSGLARMVYGEHGISLPRRSRDQVRVGREVDWNDLRAGDLLFFSRTPSSREITHVGIAMGDGNMIHASLTRHAVVIDPLDLNYFQSRRVAARRVVDFDLSSDDERS